MLTGVWLFTVRWGGAATLSGRRHRVGNYLVATCVMVTMCNQTIHVLTVIIDNKMLTRYYWWLLWYDVPSVKTLASDVLDLIPVTQGCE